MSEFKEVYYYYAKSKNDDASLYQTVAFWRLLPTTSLFEALQGRPYPSIGKAVERHFVSKLKKNSVADYIAKVEKYLKERGITLKFKEYE